VDITLTISTTVTRQICYADVKGGSHGNKHLAFTFAELLERQYTALLSVPRHRLTVNHGGRHRLLQATHHRLHPSHDVRILVSVVLLVATEHLHASILQHMDLHKYMELSGVSRGLCLIWHTTGHFWDYLYLRGGQHAVQRWFWDYHASRKKCTILYV